MGWSELTSLIDFPLHLIQGPDPELYDLERDPGETKNLRDDERRSFHALREAIAPFQVASAQPAQEDAETAAKLAALGYLGAAARPGARSAARPEGEDRRAR